MRWVIVTLIAMLALVGYQQTERPAPSHAPVAVAMAELSPDSAVSKLWG